MRLWLISPERLWRLSIALQHRGHWVLAFWTKQLNTLLYHNSLSPAASVAADIHLGHYGLGVVVNGKVVIGERVKIWHNVTLTVRTRAQLVIEDDVKIGTGAIVIAPPRNVLRIGAGARVGAGTVVTSDVPPGATIVGAAARVVERGDTSASAAAARASVDAADDDSLTASTEALEGAAGDGAQALEPQNAPTDRQRSRRR
jgi:serine O-acetyltransferase